MAARTEQEILDSFKTSVQLSDATVDVEKGPLYSLVGRPLSQILAPVEAEVARLEQIYSSEFAKVATTDEAQAFLTNWGETAGAGSPATVRVFFMTFTRPRVDQIIEIPLGSLVSNYDQTLQYITVESGQIRGDIADSYYNAQRRSYEVGLLCQAVAVGSNYELPAGRINTKVSPVEVDVVENREKCTPGSAAETIVQQIERVQQKFTGLAINTANGAYTRIKRFAPTAILDIKAIPASNRTLFRRLVYGPGLDYYILGNVPKTIIESYTAQGGETEIAITNVPAISINSVSINNVAITNYTLRADSSEQYGLSAKAQDILVLGFPLLSNDVVTFSVTYNSIIQEIQQQVLSETKLFNTDELARAFKPIPITIEVTGRALASYDPLSVQVAIKSAIENLIPTDSWQEYFYPSTFMEQIKQNVAGLSNLQLVTFQRSISANAKIEIVIMDQNEIAVYDSNYVNVQIRQV